MRFIMQTAWGGINFVPAAHHKFWPRYIHPNHALHCLIVPATYVPIPFYPNHKS